MSDFVIQGFALAIGFCAGISVFTIGAFVLCAILVGVVRGIQRTVQIDQAPNRKNTH